MSVEMEHPSFLRARTKHMMGIKTDIEVVSGSATPTILEVARSQHVDLIIMSSYGNAGVKRWWLGSVTQHVVRQNPVPVLVLRGGIAVLGAELDKSQPPVRVLVSLDGSPLVEVSLAPAALHLARVLALPKTGRREPEGGCPASREAGRNRRERVSRCG